MLRYSIRPVTDDDVRFLWDMLYESLYVPERQKPFDRGILNDPHLSKYVEEWGKEGDFGFIAINDKHEPVGSITSRFFNEKNKGFGYVHELVPELGMALLKEYRGEGIGTCLMNELIKETKKRGINCLSLSVDPGNIPAMKLYERFGFKEIGMVDTSITMMLEL